jgi:hypothetical protein
VGIDSQTDGVSLEIECRVEVFEKCDSHNVDILVLSTKLAFTEHEETLIALE